MKLEDCEIGMKVKVLGKTIWGDKDTNGKRYPAHERGWGYINSSYKEPIRVNDDTVYLAATLGGIVEAGAYSPNDLEPYEAKETEYRQLKDITPRAIYEAHGLFISINFMQEFTRFVNVFDLQYDETVPFSDLTWEFENEPVWTTWLIQHRFIEKVVEEKPEEVTHSIGDTFLNKENRDKYLLAAVGELRTIALINLASGNTWSGNMQVKRPGEVTETELRQLMGSWDFVKIEGK